MGFYYNEGFYYDEAEGFYYDTKFLYDQRDGFYYDQQQGLNLNANRGKFLADKVDKFNKTNKDFWTTGDGQARMLEVFDKLKIDVDVHINKEKPKPGKTAGAAIQNVVTTQLVKEVVRGFCLNTDPAKFLETSGDDAKDKLSLLLGKECQRVLSDPADHRKKWRVEGSKAKKAMDKVSEDLIPFIVTWLQKAEFKTANAGQEETLQALVARRAVKEAAYAFAKQTKPDIADEPKQALAQSKNMAAAIAKKAIAVLA